MRTAALLAALLLVGCIGQVGRDPSPSPSHSVPSPGASAAARASEPGSGVAGYDAVLGVPPVPSARPAVTQPSSRVVVVAQGGRTSDRQDPSGRSVRGTASWYDDGPGLYAAAGPALRRALGGERLFRGKRVRVSFGGRSVVVVLSDWCQCYFRTNRERVIDLSPDAFERLAPLSKGLVKVSVTW